MNQLWRGSYASDAIESLFDANWYLSKNPDVAATNLNPLEHYIKAGATEGRDPNPFFDSDWYLAQQADVAAANVNPLIHYAELGAHQLRDPHPLFDADWYAANNPEVASFNYNPLLHFLKRGFAEGRDPNPLLPIGQYVRNAGERPSSLAALSDYVLGERKKFLHDIAHGQVPIVTFYVSQPTGLFSCLTYCLLLSKICMQRAIEPHFFLCNLNSSRAGLPPNYFSYYFVQKNLSKYQIQHATEMAAGGRYINIRNRSDINRFWCADPSREFQNTLTSLDIGRQLFHRNIGVRDYLVKVSEDFKRRRLPTRNVLGVHYRGADKAGDEADAVPFEVMLHAAKKHFGGHSGIFLATDDISFFECFLSSELGRFTRYFSTPSRKFHKADLDSNFRKGALAVIDWLLLAQCKTLIKNTSQLSAWSKMMSSELRVVTVGRPYAKPHGDTQVTGYGYWPENCLHGSSWWSRFRNRVVENIPVV